MPKARRNPYVQNTHSCSKNAVIGKQPLRSDKVEFENYELAYITYNVRKDVPRSKAIAEADWNTSTASVVYILESSNRKNPYVQCTQRRLTFRGTKRRIKVAVITTNHLSRVASDD